MLILSIVCAFVFVYFNWLIAMKMIKSFLIKEIAAKQFFDQSKLHVLRRRLLWNEANAIRIKTNLYWKHLRFHLKCGSDSNFFVAQLHTRWGSYADIWANQIGMRRTMPQLITDKGNLCFAIMLTDDFLCSFSHHFWNRWKQSKFRLANHFFANTLIKWCDKCFVDRLFWHQKPLTKNNAAHVVKSKYNHQRKTVYALIFVDTVPKKVCDLFCSNMKSVVFYSDIRVNITK